VVIVVLSNEEREMSVPSRERMDHDATPDAR